MTVPIALAAASFNAPDQTPISINPAPMKGPAVRMSNPSFCLVFGSVRNDQTIARPAQKDIPAITGESQPVVGVVPGCGASAVITNATQMATSTTAVTRMTI